MNRSDIVDYLSSKVFAYGTFGKMLLLPNGNIALYNTYNERTWELDFDARSGAFKLLIYGDCKRLTATFVFAQGSMNGALRDGGKVTLSETTFESKPDSTAVVYQPDYEKIAGLVSGMRETVAKVASQYSRIALMHHYPTGYTNIGDAVQYIAMQKMLSDCKIKVPVRYVYRDFLCYYKPRQNELLIVNGCIDNGRCEADSSDTLFLGIHGTSNQTTAWLKKSKHSIGVRDTYTKDMLTKASVECYFSGCPTLGFDRYTGHRDGIVCGDSNSGLDASMYSHICSNLFPDEQNKVAQKLLNAYQSAEMVYTSKLHCALPSIAFGTPLVLKEMPNDGRTELLNTISKGTI